MPGRCLEVVRNATLVFGCPLIGIERRFNKAPDVFAHERKLVAQTTALGAGAPRCDFHSVADCRPGDGAGGGLGVSVAGHRSRFGTQQHLSWFSGPIPALGDRDAARRAGGVVIGDGRPGYAVPSRPGRRSEL
jgi:hypothetical protein